MFSKWFDSCANLAAFHYQSAHFQKVVPPSFGNHPEVESFTRNRQRVLKDLTLDEYQAKLEQDIIEAESPSKAGFLNFLKAKRKRRNKKIPKPKHRRVQSEHKPIRTPDGAFRVFRFRSSFQSSSSMVNEASSEHSTVASTLEMGAEDPIASPFLQESAHLYSLLSAVALATLRNDIPEVEPPLARWEPDDAFPPVDPDNISKETRREYGEDNIFWSWIYFLLGLSRSPKQRTLYNHARPFKVLGGVSIGEVEALRRARGPYAKVALCYLWIQEFISREQLNGGLGAVATPIVSRAYQFASDGMKGYNECRKIAFVPFPFAHEQLTAIFMLVMLWIFPILFYSFVNSAFMACLLNYSTVLCFVGLHEVAREMESPFMRVPNNLPLNTFQAQFNEALITTWAGFHPDSWFDLPEVDLPCIVEVLSRDNANEEVKAEDVQTKDATAKDLTAIIAQQWLSMSPTLYPTNSIGSLALNGNTVSVS